MQQILVSPTNGTIRLLNELGHMYSDGAEHNYCTCCGYVDTGAEQKHYDYCALKFILEYLEENKIYLKRTDS